MRSGLTTKTIRANGIELYLEISGRGEPLLLLHGMGGCAQDWVHAGKEILEGHFQLIAVDARGHGHSTGRMTTHRQHALDVRALLAELCISRCKAIGMSMGGNTLLHVAAQAPESLAAMVLVSATPYFPEQARLLMRSLPAQRPAEEWRVMRERHVHGDSQIQALFDAQRELADSYTDLCFTPSDLARVTPRTLIVYGDRDPLYPVGIGVELYRALPNASLWVVPGGGHGPVFLEQAEPFARAALAFLCQ